MKNESKLSQKRQRQVDIKEIVYRLTDRHGDKTDTRADRHTDRQTDTDRQSELRGTYEQSSQRRCDDESLGALALTKPEAACMTKYTDTKR